MKKICNIICIAVAVISFLVFVGEVDDFTAKQTLLIKSISLLGLIASIKGIEKTGKKEN